MKRAVLALVLALLALAGWVYWPQTPLSSAAHADRIVVSKAQRTLELFAGPTLLKRYSVSLGKHPVGPKSQQGDGRTPEGIYRLDYRNPQSAFHKALHISYPSPADSAAARAKGVDPGGLVMVHGLGNRFGWLGRLHRLVDWTDGCVAVTDVEIDEIYGAVSDGATIELKP